MEVILLTCFSTLLLTQLMAATAAVETVKVSTTPIFPEIPQDQARKDFQVLLRVEAPAAVRPEARVPVDVVAVLDVSGSMNDPAATPAPERKTATSKLDLLKTAAKFMVSKLDDGDRLSIVAFNDRPVRELSSGLLYMTGHGRRSAMRSVGQLEARGGTALGPAFEEAVKILDGRQQGDGPNRLGFIVLLTDGEDTSGLTLSERRREVIRGGLGRYPVHTFGLGTAHDPEVLINLAQESHGTYSFVDDENIGEVAGALAVCLGGLTTVAAVDTRVVLTVNELNGVRIHRVDSGGYDTSVSCGGSVTSSSSSCEVAVGVLYVGEAKHFVVHLNVPTGAAPSSSSTEGGYYCHGVGACDRNHHHHRHDYEQHLLAVGYSYRDHPSAREITVEGHGHGVFVRRSPPAVLELDGRRHAPVPSLSPVVLQHIVRFELLEVVAGVLHGELITDGRARAAHVLQAKWEEFRACHQFWGGGLDLLSGLEKEVDGMVSSLRAGAAGYVYAWVSSHQMQRATSIGSPEKAAVEFLTPAMRLFLEEARELPRWQAGTTAEATNVEHAAGGCVDDFEMVDRRLELWSRVKRDVQHLVSLQEEQAAVDDEHQHLAAVFQEASLEAIDRAMYRDIYLAVVYASKQRRCQEVKDVLRTQN